ncbi:MAG TPA: hypothetical protein VFS34_06150, partial [Thermoanaerobaculia bacterium]|nr:hypothetical protein [Thermoanaerobaculia bacterium]
MEHEMDAADRAAVGTSSAETGPRLVLNFTSDRRQIVAAIRSVGTSRTPDGAKDPLALAFALPGSPVDQAFAAESEDTGAAVANGTTQLFGNQARKDVDRLTVARISRLLAGMQSLAAALDLVEGKKRILYFSA